MALATLSIDLEAKLAGLEQGMSKAAYITQQSTQKMEQSLASVRAAAFALGSVIGTALAPIAILNFVRSTASGVDALNDLKDATGASIENISALENVAARTGTSFEGVSTALVKFNKVLSEAKPASDTANLLRAIGLSAQELKKIDPAEALRQTAVALSNYADDGSKARIVQELFGKSVKEVAPFLKDLATQGKLVATVTTEQAEAAEKFNQQLDGLKKNSTDFARSVVSSVLPALNELFKTLNENAKNKRTWAQILGVPEDEDLGDKSGGVNKYADRIQALQKVLESTTITEERRLRVAQQLRALQAQSQVPLSDGSFEKTAASFGGGAGLPSIKAPRTQAEIAAAEAAARKRTTEAEKLARLLLEGEEQTQKDITEAQIAEQDIRLKSYKDDLAARQEELKQFFEFIDAEQEREVAAGQAFADGITTASAEAIERMKKFSEEAQATFTQTLGDNVLDVLDGNFKNIEKSWGNLLKRLAAQAIAAEIGKKLFGDTKSGDSGIVGIALKALFANANGNAFDGSGVQKFARGDIFNSPTMFAFGGSNLGIMGEAGPEAVMPLKRGKDGKLGVAGGGGGVVINNNGDTIVGQGVSRGEVDAAVRAGNAQTETRIRRMFRDGVL